MPTVTYVGTAIMGDEPNGIKAVAVVTVDGQEVRVSYWPSIIPQFSKAENRAYLEAEALVAAGYLADARAHLAAHATGTDTRTYDGTGALVDGECTRNFAQRWIDEHPDPVAVAQTVDPLSHRTR